MSLHHSFVPNMILKPIFSASLLLTMSFSFLTGLLSCYAILCFNFSSLVPALFNCAFFPLFSPSISLSLLRSFIFIKLLDFVQDESSCSVDSRGVKHVNRFVYKNQCSFFPICVLHSLLHFLTNKWFEIHFRCALHGSINSVYSKLFD